MPYRCHSRNQGLLDCCSSCRRFAAARSLRLSGLVSRTAKMRSSDSISAMVCSASIPSQSSSTKREWVKRNDDHWAELVGTRSYTSRHSPKSSARSCSHSAPASQQRRRCRLSSRNVPSESEWDSHLDCWSPYRSQSEPGQWRSR
jgi:hypothetical protein